MLIFVSMEEVQRGPLPARLPSCPRPQLCPILPGLSLHLSALLSCSNPRDGACSAHPQKPFLTTPHPLRMNDSVLFSILDGLSGALHLSLGACGGISSVSQTRMHTAGPSMAEINIHSLCSGIQGDTGRGTRTHVQASRNWISKETLPEA